MVNYIYGVIKHDFQPCFANSPIFGAIMQLKTILASLFLSFTISNVNADQLSGSTTAAPSSIDSSGSIGDSNTPPVCNPRTQKLHWNGSNWQCLSAIANAPNGSVIGYFFSGQTYGSANGKAGYYTLTSCRNAGGHWILIESNGFNTYYVCFR